MQFTPINEITLKGHPILSEKWIHNIIKNNPSILGFGNIYLKDYERTQYKAGRLDLLLQHAVDDRRYEVEIQLGQVDESHIIRSIEYWDIERKRYPQYEHVAVIIAETVNARFLNVISLFNGHIPIIALQMKAIELPNNSVGLIFTRVLDHVTLGAVDEDETESMPADRKYWEDRSDKDYLEMCDQITQDIQSVMPGIRLNYTKPYIGFNYNERSNNFALLNPQKSSLLIRPKMAKSDVWDEKIESSKMSLVQYKERAERYYIKVSKNEFNESRSVILEIMLEAYKYVSA